ncbi:MAG: hypothetical protein P4M11_11850, partial [Candidatus Pacebacteria bacterium]|nr:hypothetical protein [Candidatus Paceibacterota bacterium]
MNDTLARSCVLTGSETTLGSLARRFLAFFLRSAGDLSSSTIAKVERRTRLMGDDTCFISNFIWFIMR